AVPGGAARAVASGRGPTDPSREAGFTALLADAQGPIREGVAGDAAVAARGARRQRQVPLRAPEREVSRPVPRRAVAHPATAHPGLAASGGPESGPRLPGRRDAGRRRSQAEGVTAG